MDLDALKSILGIEGRQNDVLVEFAADMSEQYIKNYCRISAIPTELEAAALNMAADFYRAEKEGDTFVKRLEEGDVAVTFEREKRNFDEVVKGYTCVLDVFRKVGW